MNPMRSFPRYETILLIPCAAAVLAVAAARPTRGQEPSPVAWKIKFDGSRSCPTIGGGILCVGSADGAIYALDPRTGEARWRFQTGEGLPPGDPRLLKVLVHDGATGDEAFRAGMTAIRDRERGTRRVDMTPVIDGETVFVGSEDFSLYALDATTGARRWSYDAKERIFIAAVLNRRVYAVTSIGLHALDAATGARVWLFETLREIPPEKMNMGLRRRPEGPVMGSGVLYLTAWPTMKADTPQESFLYAVDLEGESKWVAAFDGLDIGRPVVAESLVLVSVERRPPPSSEGPGSATLYAVDVASGEVRWRFDAPVRYVSHPILIAGPVVGLATDEGLFVLGLATGRLRWSFRKDEVGGALAADGSVYVVTQKASFYGPRATLHALSLSEGQELWTRGLGM